MEPDGLDPALWRGGDLSAPATDEQLLCALNEEGGGAGACPRNATPTPAQTPPRTRAGGRRCQRVDGCARVEPGPEDMSLAQAKEIMRTAAREAGPHGGQGGHRGYGGGF